MAYLGQVVNDFVASFDSIIHPDAMAKSLKLIQKMTNDLVASAGNLINLG